MAKQTPFKSVKEVIDYAKANPGKLNYGSVGIGSSAHLATVLFSDSPASRCSTCRTARWRRASPTC